jgi:hypothetical protein
MSLTNQGFWISQLFTKPSLCAVRLSFCFLYLRLFRGLSGRRRLGIKLVMAVIAAYYVSATIASPVFRLSVTGIKKSLASVLIVLCSFTSMQARISLLIWLLWRCLFLLLLRCRGIEMRLHAELFFWLFRKIRSLFIYCNCLARKLTQPQVFTGVHSPPTNSRPGSPCPKARR